VLFRSLEQQQRRVQQRGRDLQQQSLRSLWHTGRGLLPGQPVRELGLLLQQPVPERDHGLRIDGRNLPGRSLLGLRRRRAAMLFLHHLLRHRHVGNRDRAFHQRLRLRLRWHGLLGRAQPALARNRPTASSQIKFDMQLNVADGVTKSSDLYVRDAQAILYQGTATSTTSCGSTIAPFCDDRIWCTTTLQP
jgi:hypothetical protein